jgi:membrane-bound acyltransferase YfiQ involved in biofilm formation
MPNSGYALAMHYRTAEANRSPVIGTAMSFGIYLLGFVIVIGGLAWGLAVAHVPGLYIAIGCVVMLGLGILTGVARTRQKDAP